jgi:hypothetical protein
MPFDSSGTFNRVIPGGWQADAAAGTKIRADRHDSEDDGFATGLSTCITKDGRTQPTADIPMNGKKLINLGEPTNPQDAVTRNYVDTFKTFNTGAVIAGAGPINGFINFTAPTGVNGISWATADMAWIGRDTVANQTRKLLAINDKTDGTGSDVFRVDEGGIVNGPNQFSNNLSYDAGGVWRNIAAGTGSLLGFKNGSFNLYVNDTPATTTYQPATLRAFFTAQDSTLGTFVTLDKKASGEYCRVTASMAGKNRWIVDLGDGTAETATDRVGSDFEIYSYDNAGATAFPELNINRATHLMTTGGALTVAGQVYSTNDYITKTGIFRSDVANVVLATGVSPGAVYLRPNTAASNYGEVNINTDGTLTVSNTGLLIAGKGVLDRQGMSGAYTGNVHNFIYASPYFYAYVNDTNMGAIAWQSDYRMKKDIQPLPSMWDIVKRLSPIQYSIKEWGLFKNDDTPRWGFVAHELQEKLLPSAATGTKDEEDVVQSPNPWTVIAALTKALQEAMRRIEVLEARA